MTDHAHDSDRARGLDPDFSTEEIAQAEQATDTPPPGAAGATDLRALLWCSIDNDDSRDLDQLTMAEALPGDQPR